MLLFYALKGIAKSNGNIFAIASKSKKEKKIFYCNMGRAIIFDHETIMKRNKEIIPKMEQRRLRAIYLQGAAEISPILLSPIIYL